jgi:DNA repair ATPase RecN
MSDLDIDTQMNSLELEWRQAYESSISLRAEYQALAASPAAKPSRLDKALERLDRTEALKARIMAKIERLEDSILGKD